MPLRWAASEWLEREADDLCWRKRRKNVIRRCGTVILSVTRRRSDLKEMIVEPEIDVIRQALNRRQGSLRTVTIARSHDLGLKIQ